MNMKVKRMFVWVLCMLSVSLFTAAQEMRALHVGTGLLDSHCSLQIVDGSLYVATDDGIKRMSLANEGKWDVWKFGSKRVTELATCGQHWMVAIEEQPEAGSYQFSYRLMSSEDGGATFAELSTPDGGEHWKNVRAIALNPSDSRACMVSTEQGLWESVDGGISWEKLSDIADRFIAYHPRKSQLRYMCGSSGIYGTVYRSEDSGHTWSVFDTVESDNFVYNLDFHPNRDNLMCFGHWYGAGVSDDGGLSWRQHGYPAVPRNSGGVVVFDRRGGTDLYYAFSRDNTVYLMRSCDDGLTWNSEATLSGIPGEYYGNGLSMVQQGDTIYFATSVDVYAAKLSAFSGIDCPSASSNSTGQVYDIGGRKRSALVKGVNIVSSGQRQARKVAVK